MVVHGGQRIRENLHSTSRAGGCFLAAAAAAVCFCCVPQAYYNDPIFGVEYDVSTAIDVAQDPASM